MKSWHNLRLPRIFKNCEKVKFDSITEQKGERSLNFYLMLTPHFSLAVLPMLSLTMMVMVCGVLLNHEEVVFGD